MNVPAMITLGITIASFMLGIIYKLIDLSVRFGRFSRQLEENERRDLEEREKSARKFEELFRDRNRHDSSLARLEESIRGITSSLAKIDSKLDRIMEGGRN